MGTTINPSALTREQQAALNNLRGVLGRQLRPASKTDPTLLAELILQNALLMRENGLASELLDYLQRVRDKVEAGNPLHARLSIEMAVTLDAIDGQQQTAGELFQTTLAWYQAHSLPLAEGQARIAFGRFLIHRSQLEAAMAQYQEALELLKDYPAETAIAQSEIGRVLVGQGKFSEAVSRFEKAYALSSGDGKSTVRLLNDFAAALIELGEMERAERLLHEGIETSTQQGLWLVRANLRRQMAYIYHLRAEKLNDAASAQPYLDEAERLLHQTIAEMLPLQNTLDLAVVYHDLGRIETQQRQFAEAEANLRLSLKLFQRLGNLRNEAVAEITLGTLMILKNGDIAAGNEHLHRSLQLADKVGDGFTLRQAAETLTRLHQLQANRAKTQPREIRIQVIDQLSFSRAKLVDYGLPEAAQVMTSMMTELEAL
ncbi:MAG: tetratricopeptide repeat protein [Anaerolineae bacterium]|nr:tetratricopeptide repeat protein [Anaerolineae bacterium]